MTSEQFLQVVTQYQSIIRPATFRGLTASIRAGNFENEEAQKALFKEMERAHDRWQVLDQAEQEQVGIYNKGIEDLKTVRRTASEHYGKIMKETEIQNRSEDMASAEKALADLSFDL